jgi:hypothetical protein
MFERKRFGWLLGRPALSGGAVGWAGVAIFPNFSASVRTAAELGEIFRTQEVDSIFAFGCTASENLVAAMEPKLVERIAPRIIDLPLAMRIAVMGGEPEKTARRTIDLLAECIDVERKKHISEEFAVSLLEGRVNVVGNFNEVDDILRSLLRSLAQRLRRAGELRRYIMYELPAHKVLLAQSRFRLLADVEGVNATAGQLSSTLRVDRVELLTKHALDPADFIASFEARRIFAGRHLGVIDERLTLGEFRRLLDELAAPDTSAELVAAYLRNDASSRALLSLAAADETGCQVMYDSIGTSTGRVVMRSPGVQWLEKKYRKYIIAPEGCELRYLDYSCFEPTILAAVSGDAELLAACTSDVYERVREWLGLEKSASRDLAKAVLLRFIYGQSQERLVDTLSSKALLEREDARSRLEGLRRQLSRAFEFRAELEERARLTGYMETQVGNRCMVTDEYVFKALSHYLQGTGSLIFKRALVDIFGGASVARLVVPMHDAFLCAFPTEILEDCLQWSTAVMQSAFLAVVGVDLARVSVRGNF